MFGFSSKIRSITNFDKQHERILPPPTHHNISWTSKLISRDLKSVTKGKGSRIANKVMGIFVTKKPIPKVPATGQQPSSTLAITTPAVIQGPELTSKNLKCAVPKHIKKNSESIADAGSKEQVFGIRPDTCETGVTSSEGHAVPDDVLIPIPKVLQEKSFYTILSDKLEFWYKNRKFGLPHQDRWLTRGICVFLHIVVQVCPFNPTYDLLRGEREGPDHNKFVRELLRKHLINYTVHLSIANICM